MNDERDPYELRVAIRHPDRPTVEVALSWLEEPNLGDLPDAAYRLTNQAALIAKSMEEKTNG